MIVTWVLIGRGVPRRDAQAAARRERRGDRVRQGRLEPVAGASGGVTGARVGRTRA